MPAELHEVQSWDELQGNPGAYMLCRRADGSQFPIISCPFCGYIASASGHNVESVFPLTISPSFGCPNDELRKSGQPYACHYYIRHGKVISA